MIPAIIDKRGRFLMPGCKVVYKDHMRRVCMGTVTVFGQGWVRVRTTSGSMVTKKPARVEVAA